MADTTIATQSTLIGYVDDFRQSPFHFHARVFGVLAALASPVVQHYYSDLYHDAKWVEKYVPANEDTTFYFSVRDCGTLIGTDRALVGTVGTMYLCAVKCDPSGRIMLHVTNT